MVALVKGLVSRGHFGIIFMEILGNFVDMRENVGKCVEMFGKALINS